MIRLTTDNPETNLETLLNYAFAQDKRVILRYADGDNKDLCEYISEQAKAMGCNMSPEDVMDGSCLECDCVLSILYIVATQAAELRDRLKAYEDIADLDHLRDLIKAGAESLCQMRGIVK